MNTATTFLGMSRKNRSVLASGVLGVSAASLRRVFREGAGLVTSKSVGPRKRKGHNAPVIFDWGGGLINAVGLSNPGIDDFIVQYERIPIDFPVIISIYGEVEEDFVTIAEKLAKVQYDFIELNLSCPNVSDEFGTPFAYSRDRTSHITSVVKGVIDRPVIVKLSPNTQDLVGIAKAAEEAGADAVCVINTVGPGMIINTNTAAPLLGNRWGGVSGRAILPLTIKSVYELYRNVKIPIIGTGGITDADSALQVLMAGASLYGIGSAVYQKGISIFREIDENIRTFLGTNGFQDAGEIIGLSHRSTTYSFYETAWNVPRPSNVHLNSAFTVVPVHAVERSENGRVQTLFFDAERLIVEKEGDSPDQLKLFERMEGVADPGEHRPSFRPKPGQFYMLWLPGVNQKPYSVSYFDGRLIGFTCKRRGCFSDKMFTLEPGEPVGLLGPLGKGFDLSRDNYLLVGGGIGSAPLVFAAMELIKRGKKTTLFFGAECAGYLDWVEPLLRRAGTAVTFDVHYGTEDGSRGMEGMITDHLADMLDRIRPDYTLLCGPEMFITNSIPILREKNIDGQASIERMMKCGIGICGSCSVDHTGDRVCREGPVFDVEYLQQMKEFGSYALDESGSVIEGVRKRSRQSS